MKQLIFFENEIIEAKQKLNKHLCFVYELGRYIHKYSPASNRMFLTQCKEEYLKGIS